MSHPVNQARPSARLPSAFDPPSDTCCILEAGSSPLRGYTLDRLRGRGGYAEVWEATNPEGQRIALKFMSTQHVSATARELRALRALHTLEHPHLLKSQSVWSIAGFIVIGMELAEATLLDLYLLYSEDLKEPMGPALVLKYLYHAAQGLDFLNAKKHSFESRQVGYQHGDIKPNNIMILGDTAKLADYGLATPISGGSTPCHRHGTLDYMAPEVFRGQLSDSSDQYSLAVSYCILRAGSFPFPQITSTGAGKSIHRDQPDLSNLPASERAALSRSLSPVPQNRFPTCCDLIHSLAKAAGLPLLPPPTELPPPNSESISKISKTTDSKILHRSNLGGSL